MGAPQVVVRGEAVLRVPPEVADLVVGIRCRARDRESALRACADRSRQVAAVLADAGDAVEAQETSGLSVQLEGAEPGPAAPVARVDTRITVAPPDVVGELVVALGRLEDVSVHGPTWRLRPDSPVPAQARLAAVQDAVRRARQYAAAFGAELTELVEVADTGPGSGLRVAAAVEAVARFEASGPSLDLTPSPQEVHGWVEVRFATSAADPEVFRR